MTKIIDVEPIQIEGKPEEDKPKEPKKSNALEQVKLQDGSALPVNMDQMRTMATVWIQGGGVPKAYKNWQQVVAGLSFARGMGLPIDVSSLKNIAVINGNPSLFGDLPKKLAEETGELEYFDEYLIDKDKNRIEFIEDWNSIYASVCEIQRKGKKKKKFTFTRFQAEKGIKGIKAIWDGYFDVMMLRKVRARALNSEFTSELGGRPIVEYDNHFAPDAPGMEEKMKDVTNSASSDVDFL